jgi:peptidoglycan/LPS O-acetylase OafA/YrhL
MTAPLTDLDRDLATDDPVAPIAAPTIERRFRPDIEGLRAVAVTLVVLYHAGVPWLPGGYVGVDVFFVVSGFLITGLLFGELRQRGTFSLIGFYARRMRRLLPASVLVLVSTVVLMKVFASPLSSVGFRGDGMATALYASNIQFAAGATNYLADPAPSPLLHYWSLAVEEQFYLVWPLLLLVASRLRRGALVRRVGIVVGTVGLASLALSLYLTPRNQPFSFFLLPTRAWELAVGAGVALVAGSLHRIPRRAGALLAWWGLVGIAAAAFLYDERTMFPGAAALLPVLGTAAVIAGGGAVLNGGGPARLLELRPFQWVGRLSYSLYLWHWPLLVIPALGRADSLPAPTRAGLVALSVLLAVLTHRFVEDPIRNARPLVGSAPRSFALGAVLTTVALIATFFGGVLPALDAGRPAAAAESAEPDFVPSDLQPTLRGAFDDLSTIWRNGCHANIPSTTAKGCVFGNPDSDTSVVLFGDSHAAQWFPAFQRAAEEQDWRLVTLTKSGCPALDLPVFQPQLGRRYTECETWRRRAFAHIAEEHDPVVVVADSRGLEPLRGGSSLADAWQVGLRATIDELPPSAKVIVLGDTPRSLVNVPVCLSDHLKDVRACAPARADALDPATNRAERAAAAATDSPYIDPTEWVCPGDPCAPIRGNLLVWRDDHHLPTPFAASLTPQLLAAMQRALR